jgi:hypothetical protein
MPQYFKRWDEGLPELRARLKRVDDVGYFGGNDKKKLEQRMRAAGYPTDQANSIPLTGRGQPLLAVFDPVSVKIAAIFRAR